MVDGECIHGTTLGGHLGECMVDGVRIHGTVVVSMVFTLVLITLLKMYSGDQEEAMLQTLVDQVLIQIQ